MNKTMNRAAGTSDIPVTENAEGMLTGRARSLANLRPFVPGHPPTVGAGRPRKDHKLLRELSRALADKVPGDPQHRNFRRLIVQALIKAAAKGNVDAMKVILDREVGRVRDQDEPIFPSSIIVNIHRNTPRVFQASDRDDDPTR
jgi:hypothetical protein